MFWKIECDICKNNFSTNELNQTVCNNCIPEKERIHLSNKLYEKWKQIGKETTDIFGIPFYFDRGFDDKFRKYNALVLSSENLKNVNYATLDFQCQVLRFYDSNKKEILNTTTTCYDDENNIKALLGFLDEDDGIMIL